MDPTDADDTPESSGPKPVQELISKRLRPRASLQERLLSVDPLLVDPNAHGPILYQHSVLCQTCLPYRDPVTEPRITVAEFSNSRSSVLAPVAGRRRSIRRLRLLSPVSHGKRRAEPGSKLRARRGSLVRIELPQDASAPGRNVSGDSVLHSKFLKLT